MPTGPNRYRIAGQISASWRADTIDTIQDIYGIQWRPRVIFQRVNSLRGQSMDRHTSLDDKYASTTEGARAAVTDAIQSLDLGLVLWDEDLGFVFGNQYWKDTFFPDRTLDPGESAIDVLRDLIADGVFILPEGLSPAAFCDQIIALIQSYATDVRIHLVEGRVLNATVHRTGLGGYLISFRDVSGEICSQEEADRQRTKTERANTRLRDALESIGEGFALFDKDDKLILANDLYKSANPAAAHLMTFGRPRKEIIEAMTRGGDIVGVEDWVDSYGRESAAGDTSSPRRYEVHHADGRVFMASRGRTAEGGCTITWLDVTEQRAIQDERRQSAERELEAVTETMQSLVTAIALFDADLNFVMGNRGYFDIWYHKPGIASAEPGESLKSILHRLLDAEYFVLPDGVDRTMASQMMFQAVATFTKNVPLETKSGSYLGHVSPAGNGGYLVEFSDITEQKALEEERRLTEARALARVTDTVESLDIALVLLDRDLNFVFCNQRHIEIYHQDVAPPEVGEPMSSIMLRLVRNDFYDDETEAERLIEKRLDIIRNATKGYEVRTHDGVILMGSVHRTPDQGYLISLTEITEQRRAESELERQREVAHQNEKLSAMGELLAGVAHELNNPLSIVVGYAMMMQNTVQDPKLKRQVDNVAQAAERCSRIVKAFLAMARQRPAELKRCSLNELLMAALDMVGHRLRASGVDVTMELQPDLPDVDADEDQIIQVFTNLIVNAEQALSENDGPKELHLRSFMDKIGGKAVVRIADNGPGISAAGLPRVFEPFYTTKEVGTGTGIGLAFCHRVVHSHGGRMTVRSKPGDGARFYVRLNYAEGSENIILDPDIPAEDNSGRVLVVDDEVGVAELIGDILTEAGYQVEVRNSAPEALDLLRNQSFDAVLSDMKMPGLDGSGFYTALTAIDPTIAQRTGFITGDTLSRDVASFLSETSQPHLEKPVTPSELLHLVDDLIRRARI